MKYHSLLVGGGVVFAASGLVSLVGGVLHPVIDGEAHSVASMTAPGGAVAYPLLYSGAILLMLGLPAVYAWLAPRLGVLGLVGFGLYFVGNAVVAQPHLIVEGFVVRDLASRFPQIVPPDGSIVASPSFGLLMLTGGLTMIVGVLLVGVALLPRRTGVPRWIGVAFVLAAVAFVLPLPEAPVLSGLQAELGEAVGSVGLGWLCVRAGLAHRTTTGRTRVPASAPDADAGRDPSPSPDARTS